MADDVAASNSGAADEMAGMAKVIVGEKAVTARHIAAALRAGAKGGPG